MSRLKSISLSAGEAVSAGGAVSAGSDEHEQAIKDKVAMAKR
jgi:hypothetical protein